jgi:hypothetical protein
VKGVDFEMQSLALLQEAEYLEEVPSLWIAVGSKHAHQALGGLRGQFG